MHIYITESHHGTCIYTYIHIYYGMYTYIYIMGDKFEENVIFVSDSNTSDNICEGGSDPLSRSLSMKLVAAGRYNQYT